MLKQTSWNLSYWSRFDLSIPTVEISVVQGAIPQMLDELTREELISSERHVQSGATSPHVEGHIGDERRSHRARSEESSSRAQALRNE